MDALLSAAEAARAFGIRAGTVRGWAHRRKLLPSGLDRSGRPLYRKDHIEQLVDNEGPEHRVGA